MCVLSLFPNSIDAGLFALVVVALAVAVGVLQQVREESWADNDKRCGNWLG